MNTNLSDLISRFLALHAELRRRYGRSWVVLTGETIDGGFATFEDAALFALDRFAERPYLIRHTDSPEAEVPLMVIDGAA